MVTGRPVWVLDEPTVSLDAASVALFASAVKAMWQLAVRRCDHIDLEFEERVFDVSHRPAWMWCVTISTGRSYDPAAGVTSLWRFAPAGLRPWPRVLPDSCDTGALWRRPRRRHAQRECQASFGSGRCWPVCCRWTSSHWISGRLAGLAVRRDPLEGVVAVKALALDHHGAASGDRGPPAFSAASGARPIAG